MNARHVGSKSFVCCWLGGVKLKSNKVSVCVVLCACLLIVLGDVRFIIGSAGYWVVWCVVICSGFFLSACRFSWTISVELFVYLIGFLLVLMSFVLSGIVNDDVYTVYQGVKFFFIAVAFFCIYINARDLVAGDVYKISLISIMVGLLLFLMSKYSMRELYVELGDGRQGSQFAYPGVLWKTPVFFIGFVIAGTVFSTGNKFLSLLALIGGMFLLKSDSSRTGFLILAMVALLFVVLCAYLKPQTALVCSLVLGLGGLGLLILYSCGFVFLSNATEPLVLNRLAAGDPTRTQMLTDGVMHAQQCFPLGCGFGTATSLVGRENMVVHNAYLSSLGDLGVLGFIGMVVLMFSPIIIVIGKFIDFRSLSIKSSENLAYSVAAFGGVIGYAFLMMLHPFSTELSEWGIWILMVSMLATFSRQMVASENEVQVEA